MSQTSARAVEWLRVGQRYIDQRIDEFEKLTIRRFLVKIVGLVANGVAFAALRPVIVVIEHFFERPAINHGLIPLETIALFSFERLNRDRTKFDSLHCAPRLRSAFQDLDSIKAGILERGEKGVF